LQLLLPLLRWQIVQQLHVELHLLLRWPRCCCCLQDNLL
jgi:hypothetical protein